MDYSFFDGIVSSPVFTSQGEYTHFISTLVARHLLFTTLSNYMVPVRDKRSPTSQPSRDYPTFARIDGDKCRVWTISGQEDLLILPNSSLP